MIGKNCARGTLRLCCTLLMMGAPSVTRAADTPAEAAPDAKQTTLVCRDLNLPGSHVKQHVCGTRGQWSAARGRALLLQRNLATSNGPSPYPGWTAVPGWTGFGTGASQSSFQR